MIEVKIFFYNTCSTSKTSPMNVIQKAKGFSSVVEKYTRTK